jgi:hypothetical protein
MVNNYHMIYSYIKGGMTDEIKPEKGHRPCRA